MTPLPTKLSSPSTVPDLTTECESSLVRCPITTSASTTQKGPISTSSPNVARESTEARGWIFGNYSSLGTSLKTISIDAATSPSTVATLLIFPTLPLVQSSSISSTS